MSEDKKWHDKKIAFDYSFKLFDKHAQQRVQFFNFYFIVLIASFGFIGTALNTESGRGLVAAGVALTVINFVFGILEKRNRALVKISEDALKIFERDFAEYGEEIRILARGDAKSKETRVSYHQAFICLNRFAYIIASIIFFIGISS